MNDLAADINDFKAPTPAQLRRALAPTRAWFDPTFFGVDELDLRRPALFVGNHTLFSLDAPLLLERIYSQHNVLLRALGDHFHFRTPVWGTLVRNAGGVEGTPENCSELMRQGQSILVFPGGAREVMRRRGDAYDLIWKQRTGFARMAIQHGYDIIPFASVGPNETYRIVADADDIRQSAAWRWLDRTVGIDRRLRGGDLLAPLVKGIGATPLPRPERFYFACGERIPTAHLQHESPEKAVQWGVREQTEAAIQQLVATLQAHRSEDRAHWGRLRRWLAP